MGLSLSDLLKRMLEMNGSDLHITTNSPPQIRVHGHLVPLDLPQMTPAETKQLAYSVMTDSQKHRFEESLELDFSFGLKGLARFRANVFNQRGATAAVFRLIPFEIKSFNQLGLPAVVSKLCDKPRGLVLVTGPTGSGKSTTLAAMIDKINSERHDHILTIEDPIEFVHMNKNCVVNQRELHADTKSFTDALRAALREDPDVVLIGEKPQTQLRRCLAAASVFVLPSVMDPDGGMDNLPTVIMEAMATGLPVVSTNVGGIPEMVVENETGFLVQPGDIAAMADATERVIKDCSLAARLGQSGYERARALFSIEKNVRELCSLLTL